jgi:hypothetical protein
LIQFLKDSPFLLITKIFFKTKQPILVNLNRIRKYVDVAVLRLVRGVSLPICSGNFSNFLETFVGTRVPEGLVGPAEVGGPEGHAVGVHVTPGVTLLLGGVPRLEKE